MTSQKVSNKGQAGGAPCGTGICRVPPLVVSYCDVTHFNRNVGLGISYDTVHTHTLWMVARLLTVSSLARLVTRQTDMNSLMLLIGLTVSSHTESEFASQAHITAHRSRVDPQKRSTQRYY